MTRAQAIDRVCKLRALAKSTTSDNERATASKQAAVLMEKHDIKDVDLRGSGKSAAFDDIAHAFASYSAKHPELKTTTSSAIVEVIDVIMGHAKRLPHGKKTVLVDQVGRALKIAKFIFGDSNKTVNDVSTIVATILKNYDV